MSDILPIIEQIGSDTKRTHKLDVLKQHKDNPLLRRVLKMALDPFIRFYIKRIPSYTVSADPDTTKLRSLDNALDSLMTLAERRVTGNAAALLLSETLSSVSADDAIVITRIIGKDLRCGVAEATVNAVFKDLIPVYPCLLARPYDAKNAASIKFPAYSQLKADGVRANALVKDGVVTICGRSGKLIDVLGQLDKDIIELASLYGGDMFFDGELVVYDLSSGGTQARRTGNGVINKAIRGTISSEEAADVRFQIWDAFPLEEFNQGQSKCDYRARFQTLTDQMAKFHGSKILLIPSREVNSWEDAGQHFQEMLSNGEEGVIVKDFSGVWSHTRSEHLVKMKAELDADLEVVGYNPGTGQFEGMVGSLICSSSDGKVVVSISGFTHELRSWITANINAVIGKIVTVMYNERIASKSADRVDIDSLFLPRFKQFRDDKQIADSSGEIK